MSKRNGTDSHTELASKKMKSSTVLDDSGDSEDESLSDMSDSSQEEFGSPIKPKQTLEGEKTEDSTDEKSGAPSIEETDLEREKRLFEEDEARRKASELKQLETKKNVKQKYVQSESSDSEDNSSSESAGQEDDDEEEYYDKRKSKQKGNTLRKLRSANHRAQELPKTVASRHPKLFRRKSDSSDSSDDENERGGRSHEKEAVIDFKDLKVMQFTRSVLISWVDEPYLDQCEDGFVRLSIGASKNGQLQYRVCKIIGLTPCEPYLVDGVLADFLLELEYAKVRREWKLLAVSNGDFLEKEFNFWSRSMNDADLKLPTKRYLTKFVNKIKREVHGFRHTEAEIKRKIEKRKGRMRKPVNFASKKVKLEHEIDFARESGNLDEVASLESKLEEVKAQQKISLTERQFRYASSAFINTRNAEDNRRSAQSAPKLTATGEKVWNPFARMPTRPDNLWATNRNKDSPEDANSNTISTEQMPDKPELKEFKIPDITSRDSMGGSLGISLVSKPNMKEVKTMHDHVDVLDDLNIDIIPDRESSRFGKIQKTVKKRVGSGKKRMSIEEYQKRMSEVDDQSQDEIANHVA